MEIHKIATATIILTVLSFVGCSKPQIKVELSCDWPSNYKVDTSIINQTGRICVIPFRPSEIKYVIDMYGVSKRITSGSLAVCNLPEGAKIEGKTVKLSGHLLTFPDIEKVDILGNPFELTSIEVSN